MSELTRRIIFAVIAAPASIALVYFGDWVLAIVLSVLAALAAWEFYRMARETGRRLGFMIAIRADRGDENDG